MSLSRKQQQFAKCVQILLRHIWARGYTVTFGHAYRCSDCPVGTENSLHKSRLAIDLNLFDRDGEYVDTTEGHLEFGRYWEALHPDNRWGGRFNDGNHYERVPHIWRDGNEPNL